MTKIYLIRHGETDWNYKKILMGQTDIPLNPLGEKQAEGVARYFKNIACDTIYSSDLARARSTAEAIVRENGMELFIDKDLRECSAGKLEGLVLAEMLEKFPEDVAAYRKDEMNYTPPLGESRVTFIKRVSDFVGAILEKHQDQSVALVTHGGVIRALLSFILAQDFKMPGLHFSHLFRVDNCSVSLLTFNKQWEITYLNDIRHLDGLIV